MNEEIYRVTAKCFDFYLRRHFKNKEAAQRYAKYLEARFASGDDLTLTKPKVEIEPVVLFLEFNL